MFHRYPFEFGNRGRIFEKGDFKYIILDLLKDKPRHGYEIISAIEDQFKGFYTPSAGSVYPTLQMLEDLGYVSSSELDGKRTYTITEEGCRFLDEHNQVVNKIKDHMKDWWSVSNFDELIEARHELRHLFHTFGSHGMRNISPEKLSLIKEIISRATKDIEDTLKS
jgi:DNA-binding PadR family transcriptional regulator